MTSTSAHLRDLGKRWPEALVAWEAVAVEGLVLTECYGALLAKAPKCPLTHLITNEGAACRCMRWTGERWERLVEIKPGRSGKSAFLRAQAAACVARGARVVVVTPDGTVDGREWLGQHAAGVVERAGSYAGGVERVSEDEGVPPMQGAGSSNHGG